MIAGHLPGLRQPRAKRWRTDTVASGVDEAKRDERRDNVSERRRVGWL